MGGTSGCKLAPFLSEASHLMALDSGVAKSANIYFINLPSAPYRTLAPNLPHKEVITSRARSSIFSKVALSTHVSCAPRRRDALSRSQNDCSPPHFTTDPAPLHASGRLHRNEQAHNSCFLHAPTPYGLASRESSCIIIYFRSTILRKECDRTCNRRMIVKSDIK